MGEECWVHTVLREIKAIGKFQKVWLSSGQVIILSFLLLFWRRGRTQPPSTSIHKKIDPALGRPQNYIFKLRASRLILPSLVLRQPSPSIVLRFCRHERRFDQFAVNLWISIWVPALSFVFCHPLRVRLSFSRLCLEDLWSMCVSDFNQSWFVGLCDGFIGDYYKPIFNLVSKWNGCSVFRGILFDRLVGSFFVRSCAFRTQTFAIVTANRSFSKFWTTYR